MFYINNSFETIQSFENLKPGCYELAQTTQNSPGSLKAESWKLDDSPFNCSFDEGSQLTHASTIWNASVKYLQASLNDFVNTFNGFNDQALISNEQSTKIYEKSIQEIILNNDLLKNHQKYEFIGDLENQLQLKNLIRELSNNYNLAVFNQLAYVVYKIWEKKKQNQKLINNKEDDEQIIPHFDCFWQYEEQEQDFTAKKLAKFSWAPIFDAKSMQEIVIQADKCCEQIVQDIFFDSKLKFLNLKQTQKGCDEFEMVMNFTQFFKTLTRSIYLSSQGFFTQPKDEGETVMVQEFIDIEEFDFAFDEVAEIQKEEQSSHKRFIRSYDQVFQDYEKDFEAYSIPNKKRKLQ